MYSTKSWKMKSDLGTVESLDCRNDWDVNFKEIVVASGLPAEKL